MNKFENMNLDSKILKALYNLGFEEPSRSSKGSNT